MAVVMSTRGHFVAPFKSVVGRVADTHEVTAPEDTVLICRDGRLPECDPDTFAAVLVVKSDRLSPYSYGARVGVVENLDHLNDGDLVHIHGGTGRVRTLYRRASHHNALFVTEQCNSNCLMCSQPPKSDSEDWSDVCVRVVHLLRTDPPLRLGITGGEPTLLGDAFLRLLAAMRDQLPTTEITVLSNGRNFSDAALAARVGAIAHPRLRFSVPLHSDVPDVHDYIAQADGAFAQTISGLYNLAANRVSAEIRVVLHNLSIPRLQSLTEYIWRKVPFVHQVAFMGMENMGYVKKNWSRLWIDPLDYGVELEVAVEYLWRRGMCVSIYNLPFCVIPRSVWGFARQSISDHKQILLKECQGCEVIACCAGLFSSCEERHSRGISPITLQAAPSSHESHRH